MEKLFYIHGEDAVKWYDDITERAELKNWNPVQLQDLLNSVVSKEFETTKEKNAYVQGVSEHSDYFTIISQDDKQAIENALSNTGSFWTFIENYYPNYFHSSTIAAFNDTERLVNKDYEAYPEDSAYQLLVSDFGGNIDNPEITREYYRLKAEIYEAAIKEYWKQGNQIQLTIKQGIIQDVKANHNCLLQVLDHDTPSGDIDTLNFDVAFKQGEKLF